MCTAGVLHLLKKRPAFPTNTKLTLSQSNSFFNLFAVRKVTIQVDNK